MNKTIMISLLGPFLLVAALCLPVQAEDLIWQPRTGAGGAAVDPDLYLQLVDAYKYGSDRWQSTQTGGQYLLGRGYYEQEEDGSVVFYDLNGKRVNMANVGTVENDSSVGETGVKYFAPTIQTTTFRP